MWRLFACCVHDSCRTMAVVNYHVIIVAIGYHVM